LLFFEASFGKNTGLFEFGGIIDGVSGFGDSSRRDAELKRLQ